MRNFKTPFSLLELFICLMIVTLVSSFLTWKVKKVIDHHAFKNSIDRLFSEIRQLQTLALTYKTDMILKIAHDPEGFFWQTFTDEPLPFFNEEKKNYLKGVEKLTFNQEKFSDLSFTFFSSGRMEPSGWIQLDSETEKFWIDWSYPPQIKILEQKPQKKDIVIPDCPK